MGTIKNFGSLRAAKCRPYEKYRDFTDVRATDPVARRRGGILPPAVPVISTAGSNFFFSAAAPSNLLDLCGTSRKYLKISPRCARRNDSNKS